jgi:pimeloyl-ACP methyl ester carboxylesterase
MKTVIIIFSLLLVTGLNAQDKVTFTAADGLTVYANLYEIDETLPYILLFHQAGFSKGEYKASAVKLLKLGYNCLAVDLRSGDNVNFTPNETAQEAKSKLLPAEYLDAEQDMQAAIEWAYNKSKKKVVLFGSSYSASLALKIGRSNPNVKAVVAFSPGEYFQPGLVLKDHLNGYDIPVFVACSQREFTYMGTLLSAVPDNLKSVFKPQEGPGEHGSKALWNANPSSNEYWLALLLFFKTIE